MPDQKDVERMYDAARRRLGKLELVDNESNGLRLGAYLKENKLLMSEENLYRAIVACKDSLTWERGRGPKKADVQDSSSPSRPNHAKHSDSEFGASNVARTAVRKIDAEKGKRILYEIENNMIDGHRFRPYSKAERERAALTERFKMLVANSRPPVTEKQAEAIRVEVDNLRRSFPE